MNAHLARCVATAILLIVSSGFGLRAQDFPSTKFNSSSPRTLDPYAMPSTRLAQNSPLPLRLQPLPIAPGLVTANSSVWTWHLLPKDNIYPFYLADGKASRLAGQFIRPEGDNLLLDGTLGGRFGVFRLGDSGSGPFRSGIQLDIEGSAQVRLDMEEEVDVRSVDFRAGFPLSYAFGRWHTRVGYYHLSSHIGDEFQIKNPTFQRLNFARDVLIAGAGYWMTDRMRVYGEAGWAFYSDVSEEWEFKFGIEYAPTYSTGWRGSPFWAIHGHVREELDYGGSLTAQAGWAWKSAEDNGLLRLGVQAFEGQSNQWSFFDQHEPLIGVGLWYDR